MASFADVMKKVAANSVKAASNAVNRSAGANRTQERPNQPGYDPNLATAQAAAGYVPPQLAQMQPMQNAEEEQQDETENSKLRSAFGNVAKAIAGDVEGQEKTLSEDELKAMQSPVDQFLSSFGMGPETAHAMALPESDRSGASNKGSESKTQDEVSSLISNGWIQSDADDGILYNPKLHGGANNEDHIRAYNSNTGNYFTMPDPTGGKNVYDPDYYEWLGYGRWAGEEAPRTPGGYLEMAEGQQKRLTDRASAQAEALALNQALSNPFLPQDVREDYISELDNAREKYTGSDENQGTVRTIDNPTARSGRGERNTILSDYYDYLQTPEGEDWAKQYADLGYTDEEVGLANLLASGDTEAFMQLLGGSEGWNGSERLRARYNNSIPDFYDWRSGEFNDNARDMLADYLWGDQAISALGLAEGTDYLGRTLSPEDAALLAQWSNYLADNAGFGMGLEGDPYGFDSRDAALYLYATAMSGDNALDFNEDVTNRMLERAGVTQRVGEVGKDSKAALPTMQARKYDIQDLLPDADAENALNPILDNKNTGYYDRALLASIVAAANADNNGKYGIYDI